MQDSGCLSTCQHTLRVEHSIAAAVHQSDFNGPTHGRLGIIADLAAVVEAGQGIRRYIRINAALPAVTIEDGHRLFPCQGIFTAKSPIVMAEDNAVGLCPCRSIGIPFALCICKAAACRRRAVHAVEDGNEHSSGQAFLRSENFFADADHKALFIGISYVFGIPGIVRNIPERGLFLRGLCGFPAGLRVRDRAAGLPGCTQLDLSFRHLKAGLRNIDTVHYRAAGNNLPTKEVETGDIGCLDSDCAAGGVLA